MIAACIDTGNRAGGETTEAVGDQPFLAARRLPIASDVTSHDIRDLFAPQILSVTRQLFSSGGTPRQTGARGSGAG